MLLYTMVIVLSKYLNCGKFNHLRSGFGPPCILQRNHYSFNYSLRQFVLAWYVQNIIIWDSHWWFKFRTYREKARSSVCCFRVCVVHHVVQTPSYPTLFTSTINLKPHIVLYPRFSTTTTT